MDVEDLVERLCTTAGMIMEDASVGAISQNQELSDRVNELVQAARSINAMAVAARALLAISNVGLNYGSRYDC